MLFLLVLVACGPNDTQDQYDLGGIDFVIMVDNADKSDPRTSVYERLFKNEKVALINEVEEKYNVKVVYKSYPTIASGVVQENVLLLNNLHLINKRTYL